MRHKTFFKPTVAVAVFLTQLALSAPAIAYQSYGGGLTVQDEQWPSRTFNTVFSNANILKTKIDQAWVAQTDPICDQVKKFAQTPGVIRKDISVLKVTCNFAKSGSLWLDPSQLGHQVVGLRYLVPGNSIDIVTSKPAPDDGTAVLGVLTGGVSTALEYGPDNPEFTIDFEISADITAEIQNMSLNISSAVASVRNVHFNSRNFLASLALAFQPSIRQQVEGAVQKQQVDLKNQVANSLALISAAFAPVKDQGYTQVQSSFASGELLLRFVGKTYKVPTTGPGRISGAVYFTPPNGQSNPAGFCAAMSVRAETPDSFNDISQFNVTNMQQVGQTGPITGSPAPAQRYECSYAVTSVPVGVPVRIVVRAPSTSTGLPATSPVGWSGTVTLPGFGTETRLSTVHMTSSSPVPHQPAGATRASYRQVSPGAHTASTTSRMGMRTAMAPAPVAFSLPQPSVAGNTANNMNFTLVWQGMPR